MSKFLVRNFSKYDDFKNFIESLDPLYTEIIDVSKPDRFDIGTGEYIVIVQTVNNNTKCDLPNYPVLERP